MLKRIIIKEELVELTGDFRPAIILNQFLYWTERMKDTDKYIEEEEKRAAKEDIKVDIDKSCGWIYKTSEELASETMLGMSVATIRKYVKQLVEAGFLSERKNPKYKWDKTMQYRVNIYKVQLELAKLGYALEGYKLLPNINNYENKEYESDNKECGAVVEMKKAPVTQNTEAFKKITKNNPSLKNNNSIDNISHRNKNVNGNVCKNNYNKNKTRYHNICSTFTNYTEEELEQLLLDNQKEKFGSSQKL